MLVNTRENINTDDRYIYLTCTKMSYRVAAAYTLSRHGVHIGRLKKIKYLRFLCKFTSWSGETPTGNFSDVFLSWTKIMSVLIGWPHGKKMHVKEIYVIFIHLFDSEILGEIISVCSVSEHFVYETHFVARWLSSLTRTNLNID